MAWILIHFVLFVGVQMKLHCIHYGLVELNELHNHFNLEINVDKLPFCSRKNFVLILDGFIAGYRYRAIFSSLRIYYLKKALVLWPKANFHGYSCKLFNEYKNFTNCFTDHTQQEVLKHPTIARSQFCWNHANYD